MSGAINGDRPLCHRARFLAGGPTSFALPLMIGLVMIVAPATAEVVPGFECSDADHLIDDASEEELRDPKLHYRSTKLYFSQAQQGETPLFVKAVRSAMLAAHLDPTDAEYHMRMGMSLGELECWARAGKAFAQARLLVAGDEKEKKLAEEIENNIKYYWSGRFNLAVEKMDEQDFEAAAEAFEAAIAIDSTDARAYSNLGVAYHSLESYDEAIQSFESALARDPEDGRAKELFRVTKAQVARNAYNKALTKTGEEQQAALEAVLAMYREVLAQGPTDLEIADCEGMMGETLSRLGEGAEDTTVRNEHYARAIEHYREWAQARHRDAAAGGETPPTLTTDAEYLGTVLHCFRAAEQWDSTMAYGRKLIDLDPRNFRGYYYVGEALRNTGQQKEALSYLLVRQCLDEDESEAVENINNHVVGLLGRYQATDDIINASIENLENPDEVRMATGSSDPTEAWFFWEKGYVECYYNGAAAGRVEFAPPSSDALHGRAISGQ